MDTDLNNPTNLNTKFQGRIRSVSHDGTRYIYTLACEHPSDYYHQEDVTLVKCKDIIQDIKSRMREMIRRYEASGNGSDMATFDEDGEDYERPSEVTADNYGRFNSELAKMRAAARRDPMLILKDGDDRASFLKNNPPELLYVWEMMDRYDYIHFTCAKLSDENGAASDKTPHPTSRGNKKQKTKKTPKLSVKEYEQLCWMWKEHLWGMQNGKGRWGEGSRNYWKMVLLLALQVWKACPNCFICFARSNDEERDEKQGRLLKIILFN
jgi:hypothetical protein